MTIPLTKPFWNQKEEMAAAEAIRKTSGSGGGFYTLKLKSKIQKITQAKYVLPVTSCTHGLELAMLAIDLKAGDEVIMPSFTMSSTANAVVLRGGRPVFTDIERKYFCIDPDDIEKKITKKTKGIIVVHYAGMPCLMEEINRIANKNKLWVVEDAAHAIGAEYKGKALGTWGDIGVYSFHGTKNVCCGEGGAVLTNNTKLAQKMEVVMANGTNRKQFLEGKVDKYTWVDTGSSYFLSDILAGIVYVQLKKLTDINNIRQRIAQKYLSAFSKYRSIFSLPEIPAYTYPNWHIFALLFKDRLKAKTFTEEMRRAGIEASKHYVPLHSSPMGEKQKKVKLPVTDMVSSNLIRLPIYPGLTTGQINHIISSAQHIFDTIANKQ